VVGAPYADELVEEVRGQLLSVVTNTPLYARSASIAFRTDLSRPPCVGLIQTSTPSQRERAPELRWLVTDLWSHDVGGEPMCCIINRTTKRVPLFWCGPGRRKREDHC